MLIVETVTCRTCVYWTKQGVCMAPDHPLTNQKTPASFGCNRHKGDNSCFSTEENDLDSGKPCPSPT